MTSIGVQILKTPFRWPKIHPGCKFAPGAHERGLIFVILVLLENLLLLNSASFRVALGVWLSRGIWGGGGGGGYGPLGECGPLLRKPVLVSVFLKTRLVYRAMNNDKSFLFPV